MICVIYGTTGELIKLAPVLTRIHDRGYPLLTATTAQQATQIAPLLDHLGLPRPDLWLARGRSGRDLHKTTDVPIWLGRVVTAFLRRGRNLRQRLGEAAGKPLILVHGDTMTTVLGATMGRAIGTAVAHVEAGLRSFDWAHPFPEELHRRAASRLATIHYAPGPWAAGNVQHGTVVDTGSNTIRDSLAMCPSSIELPFSPPNGSFAVVSLHRFELLNDRALLAETLAVLADGARNVPLFFIDHPVTAAAVRRFALDRMLEDPPFVRIARLPYFAFVEFIRRTAFVVTDSGGTQEESYYLDVPCLVHRKRTERREGLGQNVVLSGFDFRTVRDFVADPARFRRRDVLPDTAPSDVIVTDLEARGFLA